MAARTLGRVLLGVLAVGAGWQVARAAGKAAPKDEATFDPALPPCVVASVPASRATDVDAALREIKVTFDRPMMTRQQWSWIIHTALGVYPGVRDVPPRWEDEGRTCVLSVRLRADTVYAVGCNSVRHPGFRSRDNKVAVPYVLVFKTKKTHRF